MTCLEHLIENQLARFEEHPEKTYEQYIDDIKSDINFEGAGITAEQCYEITQYVFYSYCVCRPSAQPKRKKGNWIQTRWDIKVRTVTTNYKQRGCHNYAPIAGQIGEERTDEKK